MTVKAYYAACRRAFRLALERGISCREFGGDFEAWDASRQQWCKVAPLWGRVFVVNHVRQNTVILEPASAGYGAKNGREYNSVWI